MKNSILLFILFLLVACSPESTEILQENQLPTEPLSNVRASVSAPGYSGNQLVVRFQPNTTEAKKIEARSRHKIVAYKTCACADDTLELWTFDMSTGGTIEGHLGEIVVDPDLEGELQYYVNSNNYLFNDSNADITGQLELTKASNTGVTIAVIDSGLDYNYKLFQNPFLYNRRWDEPCIDKSGLRDYSGWDFVNGDNDVHDDNGHGTVVTYLLYKNLTSHEVDFQVLPIKAFNDQGVGNYFDILCSFQYAANTPSVDIINMSFGWYLEPFDFLGQFILDASDKLIVTSGGNSGVNTEEIPHYPSSYGMSNVMGVAGMNVQFTGLSNYSNFGPQSIDVAAKGESIPFAVVGGDLYVTGTSFSNSFVSAKAAKLFSQGIQPVTLKNSIISSGVVLGSLDGLLTNAVYIQE